MGSEVFPTAVGMHSPIRMGAYQADADDATANTIVIDTGVDVEHYQVQITRGAAMLDPTTYAIVLSGTNISIVEVTYNVTANDIVRWVASGKIPTS